MARFGALHGAAGAIRFWDCHNVFSKKCLLQRIEETMRPWKELAEELARAAEPREIMRLTHELDMALEEQTDLFDAERERNSTSQGRHFIN